MQRESTPLLSILVPAYEYPEGVRRILEALGPDDRSYEVLIFDDTPGTEIATVAGSHPPVAGAHIHYVHNTPPAGPIANWNRLLDSARGEYSVLIHHDEWPASAEFVSRVLDELARFPDTDVLLLDCGVKRSDHARARRHVPMWLRALVARHAPTFLFRRNVIGPTGVLVVRRSLYPRFDPALSWLVDVDLYYRLLRTGPRVRTSDLCILSLARRPESITTRLRPTIRQVNASEREVLATRYPEAGRWIGRKSGGRDVVGRLLRSIEACGWAVLRAVTRAMSLVRSVPVNR